MLGGALEELTAGSLTLTSDEIEIDDVDEFDEEAREEEKVLSEAEREGLEEIFFVFDAYCCEHSLE